MTLKNRNQIIQLLLLISIMVTIGIIITYIFSFLNHSVLLPEYSVRPFGLSNTNIFLKYTPLASTLAIAVLLFYVIVALIISYSRFEKTQSTEVFYFCLFLAGCLSECARFLIPISGIWQSYSILFMFIGKLILLGRILEVLSLFLLTIASEPEQRKNIERNSIILITVSIILTMVTPLDTCHITSTCCVKWGFSFIFIMLRSVIFLLSIASIFINAKLKENKYMLNAAINLTLCILGCIILTSADNYLFLTLGSLLLPISTIFFLQNIHSYYAL